MSTLTKAILGVALICCVAVLMGRVGTLFFSHNYNVAAEANGLYGALEVADGRPLYPQKDVRPYAVYLYPPVFPYLSAVVMKVAGIEELRARVLAVRLISFFSLLVALSVLWKARPRSVDGTLFLFSVGLLLGSSKIADYAGSSRNDCIALAWEIAAFACFLHFIRHEKWRSLVAFLAFSVIAVWTRTNAVAVFGAGMLWLLFARKWKPAFYVAAWAVIAHAGILLFAMYLTRGEIWDHLVLANIRGFRPLNAQFFDPSLLTYLAGLFLFVPAAVLGIRNRLQNGTSEDSFVILSIALSFLLSASVFMRAGGDVNYFFLPLLIATLYALPMVDGMLRSAWGRLAVAAQLGIIGVVYWLKIQSAASYANLPYEKVADQVRKHFPPYVVLMGNYSQNLGIHLRDWAYFGPDVVNAGSVAQNGHQKLRWMLTDLNKAIAEGRVSAVIHAHPNCTEYGRMQGPIYDSFPIVEKWNDWICIYRHSDAPALALAP